MKRFKKAMMWKWVGICLASFCLVAMCCELITERYVLAGIMFLCCLLNIGTVWYWEREIKRLK